MAGPDPAAIRTAMEREGLTYRDLAFLTGLDAGYLNRIARGDNVPSRKAALRIAKALGINPETIPAEPIPEAVTP